MLGLMRYPLTQFLRLFLKYLSLFSSLEYSEIRNSPSVETAEMFSSKSSMAILPLVKIGG